MCHGTYILSYTCGHVLTTPNTCLRAIDAHYRCEPFGMKITKPIGRCVECFARDLEPMMGGGLATSVRFNPLPTMGSETDEDGGGGCGRQGSGRGEGQVRAILRWVGNVKSLRSLGSRSLMELRGGSFHRRAESSSSRGSGGIEVRRSFDVDSFTLDSESF